MKQEPGTTTERHVSVVPLKRRDAEYEQLTIAADYIDDRMHVAPVPAFPAPSPRIVAPVPAVDDYFASLDASTRAAFEHIRDLVIEIVPEAEQGTSYGMATLKYNQKPLLAFLAAKHHLSVFPFSSLVVDAVRDALVKTLESLSDVPFTDEDGRQAHLNGQIPAALGAVAADLLATDPDIRMTDIIAVK